MFYGLDASRCKSCEGKTGALGRAILITVAVFLAFVAVTVAFGRWYRWAQAREQIAATRSD